MIAAPIDPAEFRLLGEYIEKHCGIRLGPDKSYLVESRLAPLVSECGCRDFRSFLAKAVADTSLGLRDRIVDAMTTNETLWFRDGHPFRILEEVIFRELIRRNGTDRIRVWSAACSTGQEPYSAAMTIMEAARKDNLIVPHRFELLATDISPTVLSFAQAARYDGLAMSRGMSDDVKKRYFREEGKAWVVGDDIRRMVTFRKLNLQENFSHLGKFDLVLCRNVLIYFSDELRKDILGRIARQLNPGGFLVLGSSESLISFSTDFEMKTHAGALYYQVRAR